MCAKFIAFLFSLQTVVYVQFSTCRASNYWTHYQHSYCVRMQSRT